MTILETITPLHADEVLLRARRFFESCPTPGAAFVEQAGDRHLYLRGEVGEIVIATFSGEAGTIVRGSASRGVSIVSRFLSLLGQPMDVRQRNARARPVGEAYAGVGTGRRKATPSQPVGQRPRAA